MQTWMHEHPPRRGRGTFFYGSRPCVHNGFLRSWLANGLQVAGFSSQLFFSRSSKQYCSCLLTIV